jgi:glutathione S-transferase
MVLDFYVDWISQPCRAVGMLLMDNNVEHQVHEVSLMKGETQGAAYKQVNPCGKVPSIVDDGFHLGESHTIMRYLCETRNLPDHYYPKDIKQRAKVDYWLDWHHMNLRHGSLRLIRANVFGPMRQYSQQTIDELRKEGDDVLKTSLSFMDENLGKNNYIAGGNQLSIADIALACEVAMLPVSGASCEGYANVQMWLKRISTEIKSWPQANASLDQFLASKKK